MRVLVDATPLLGARTGVGQFTAHALDALRARPGLDVDTFSISWRAGTVRLPARLLHGLWRRADWPTVTGPADVVHGTNFVVPPTRGSARVATVHDLTALRFPELVTPATRAYPALIRRAVRAGAWIHTPSAFVAAEVVEAFGADPARVRAVPHGVAPWVEPAEPAFDFPYVLAVG
ncbi:MAG TPA: glycosyltransferase, partial [Acidimicrobiales bacterium]|nr:glycosyltransferase [Acidimicrobiales bacterium]